jgi:hypothetical protein
VSDDGVRSLYRTVLWLGAAAVLILAAGLGDYFYFEPVGQHTGARATITGVYRYDAQTHQTSGDSASKFDVNQQFAAVVDWGSLPPAMVVAGRWYDEFGTVVGGAGPKPAAELVSEPAVPVITPKDLPVNLPGEYTFVVERFSHGQPVELLAKRAVLVRRPLS